MKRLLIWTLSLSILAVSCGRVYEAGGRAPLAYDCAGTTLPVNIAPLNFALADSLAVSHVSAVCSYEGKSYSGSESLSIRKWRKLLSEAVGNDIAVTITAKVQGKWMKYDPFTIHIAEDRIDPYILYRLVEPGYETWNRMGIYQRCLEDFTQTPVVENRLTGYGCVNCHSLQSYNPERMLFHSRVECGGTYIYTDGKLEKYDTKTPETISALVYPQWNPVADFAIFSVNSTKQLFHTSSANRIEVFDYTSDVVVCDMSTHTLLDCPLLKQRGIFETFPTFSPEGDRIFFCSADSVAMPENYDKVRYSLCSIAFNPADGSFGDVVDTLYNARKEGRSVSFPRVSPDGDKIMFILSGYGNFSIWHKDADLYIANLNDGSIDEAEALNSDDVESYHSWSSNGRWVIFSSRRHDKLYTRLYIAYVDTDGICHKPFILPQKQSSFYNSLLKSYNIPEFSSGRISLSPHKVRLAAKSNPEHLQTL